MASGTNIRWKTPIPGLAHSSPIVWGDRVIVTTAVRNRGASNIKVGLYGSPNSQPDEGAHKFQTWCLDRDSGAVEWVRTAVEIEPDTRRHPKGSFAASTPATDGRFIAAFFGSEGLFVYDMSGELQWSRDFGVLDAGWYVAPDAQFGYASSPVIHGGLLFLQCDVQKDPFLCALVLETGEELWRVERDEVPTWSSPTVDVEHGRARLIVNGYRHMGAYDLRTGAELWSMSGGGDVPVPTPIVALERIFITNGHGRWNPIYCVDVRAEGAIKDGFDADGEPHVVWSQRRQGTYMQTPIVVGDLLFAANDAGVVSCIDARSGERLNRRRLGDGGDGFTASPICAGDKLYYSSESGDIHVITADVEMTPVALNPLGEITMATPAAVDGELYFRTQNHVIAVGEVTETADGLASDDEPDEDDLDALVAVEWLDIAGELPDADDLIAAHLSARGGAERLGAIESVDVRSNWELLGIGLKGTLRSRHKAPGLLVIDTEMPGMGDIRQGYDGETAWLSHPALGAMPLTGAMADETRYLAHWVPELRYAEDFPSRVTVGRCLFRERECFAVDLTDDADRRHRIYFDVDGGLLYGGTRCSPPSQGRPGRSRCTATTGHSTRCWSLPTCGWCSPTRRCSRSSASTRSASATSPPTRSRSPTKSRPRSGSPVQSRLERRPGAERFRPPTHAPRIDAGRSRSWA